MPAARRRQVWYPDGHRVTVDHGLHAATGQGVEVMGGRDVTAGLRRGDDVEGDEVLAFRLIARSPAVCNTRHARRVRLGGVGAQGI
jgi:hypothetical protein